MNKPPHSTTNTKTKPATNNDTNQFHNLTENVECNIYLTQNVLQELIAFNVEINQFELPRVMLLKFSLLTSRLQRSFFDLITQTDELLRLTRLYSVPWEERSQSLKRLHQHYKSKQRRFEIALNKLEMLNGRLEQLENKRILMNWEKMYLTVNNGCQHSSLGWRFALQQAKTEMKKGKTLAHLFHEMDNKSQQEQTQQQQQQHNSYAFKNNMATLQYQLDAEDDRLDNLSQFSDDDVKDNELFFSDHSDNEFESSHNLTLGWLATGDIERSLDDTSNISEQNYDDVIQEDRPSYENDLTNLHPMTEELVPMKPLVETSDQFTSTEELKFHYKLLVKVYKPTCFANLSELAVSVALNKVLLKSTFPMSQFDHEASLELEDVRPGRTSSKSINANKNHDIVSGRNQQPDFEITNQFQVQEFTFDLPDFQDEFILTTQEFLSSKIRFSFHSRLEEPMIAFASTEVEDIAFSKFPEDENKLNGEISCQNTLKLLAAMNKGEMKFNQKCGELNITCILQRQVQEKFLDQSTETQSLNEIIDQILFARKQSYFQRCKSACVETEKKPIYTESELKTVEVRLLHELSELRDDYEEKIESLLQTHEITNCNELVSMATSPVFRWVDDDGGNFSPPIKEKKRSENDQEVSTRATSVPSKPRSSKKWGKNLPNSFFTRLHMFREASAEYHETLKTRTRQETDDNITKKLKAEKKLWTKHNTSVYSTDVLLPAVFMPIKSHQSKPPSGRSYLQRPLSKSKKLVPSLALPKLTQEQRNHHDGICVEKS